MYKVLAFIRRKPGLSPDRFREYYETQHVPLIERLTPPMAAYKRNYLNLDAPYKRDENHLEFDVVTEMEFEDEAACKAWFTAFGEPAVLNEVLADEAKFVDQARLMVCPVDILVSQ